MTETRVMGHRSAIVPSFQEEKLNKVRVRQILIRFWSGLLAQQLGGWDSTGTARRVMDGLPGDPVGFYIPKDVEKPTISQGT